MEQIKKYYSSIAELRARITEITKQLEESDEFQTEMQQIDSWLENEEILFAEYDDDIVRYLIDSIRVTDGLKLIINVKPKSQDFFTLESKNFNLLSDTILPLPIHRI